MIHTSKEGDHEHKNIQKQEERGADKSSKGTEIREGVVLTQGHLIKFSGAIASVVATPGFTPYITVEAHIL